MSNILSYHNSVKEHLEKILEWADLHSECKEVELLCHFVGAVDYYVSKLVESLPNVQPATMSEFVGSFFIERNLDDSVSVCGDLGTHKFSWYLGSNTNVYAALAICVTNTLFNWWEKYDEHLPACRAELKLTTNKS